ncbi:MAG TPA: hypothetical protein VF676_01800 [Flavobacterium sp.]|jgi:hypothetical protein
MNTKNEHLNKDQHNQLRDDLAVNDGMTASSARHTKDDPESAEHPDHYDPATKPGGKYNINDQAHSQSSKEDFIKTVSNFEHSDGTTPPSQIDSKNLSPD